jgi:hypothetical protein
MGTLADPALSATDREIRKGPYRRRLQSDDMVDFVLIPPRDFVSELLREAPSFSTSREFARLTENDRATRGLVFAAFAQFIEASIHTPAILSECVAALEHFALLGDPGADNLLVTEVFESIHDVEWFVPQLLPTSRKLFDRWM